MTVERLLAPGALLRGSLRQRLLLGTLVWIALSIIVAGWALGGLFRQHVAQQFNAELGTHLDQLVAHLVVDPAGNPSLSAAQSDPRFSKPLSGLYWQIDRLQSPVEDGVGLLRSRSLWDDVLRLPADGLADGEVHRHQIPGPGNTRLGVIERVVMIEEASEVSAASYPSDPGGRAFRLVVAADERQMAEPIEHFNGMLWLALGLLGGGLAVVAVIQVRIALAPLGRLRGALGAVREGRNKRLTGDFPGEVQPLVEEFNSVLAENAEVVERARTQAGNLAHALKTPLSVIANAVRAEANYDGTADETARLIGAQVEVARRQIDYHLSRSRVAASLHIPGARTPVVPVIDGLVRVMARIHAERNLELAAASPAGNLSFRGEEQDLQEMLGNLLDNACKWAARRVRIVPESDGRVLRILVDDDGCGLPAAERERVLNRGERADEQVPGSGLGLAIVAELAGLYGGRVELADSPLGGLRVVLVLPLAE
jgi:signal transduction histidine kinase